MVLEALGLDINSKFPDVRVTGNDDDFSEGNRVTEEFVGKYTVHVWDSGTTFCYHQGNNKFFSLSLGKYYSQLSRRQILELWEVFKTDLMLFDYSIDKYLEFVSK